ncbi:MAG: serine O-acetyltransferase [Verrucomicrobiota bacterium]
MPLSQDDLAHEILKSYDDVGGINHLNGLSLPSKNEIGEITLRLMRLLFPGFYNSKDVVRESLPDDTRERIQWICAHLGQEIIKSLQFDLPEDLAQEDLMDRTQEVLCAFHQRIPQIRQLLDTDVQAAFDGDPAATKREEIILAYPGLEAISVYRMAHILYELKVKMIPRMMTEWAHSRTGIDIHPGARIGSYFFIDHGTGVVIGETTEIGHHVKIYHGVTLGALSTSSVEKLRHQKRHPTIEDNVTIYPNATILGGDTVIGEGTTVNGNVFLTYSVPAQSRVALESQALVIKAK